MNNPQFNSAADEEAANMQKEIKSGERLDRKAYRESGGAGIIVRGVVKGKVNDAASGRRDAVLKWIAIIRERFHGYVIRRTVKSVDWRKKRISGLDPYIERDLGLELYPHEMKNLEGLAETIASDNAGDGAMFGNAKVSCDRLGRLPGASLKVSARRSVACRTRLNHPLLMHVRLPAVFDGCVLFLR